MVFKKGLMFALISCFALVSPGLAKQGAADATAEVKTVMEQHNKALGAQDLKSIMILYAPGPGTVLMGTGPGETYLGEEGISGAYNQFFNKFNPDTLSFKYEWITAGSKGNIAWFAVTTTMAAAVNAGQKETAFNMSGLLQKQKGKWRIVSLHFSRLSTEEQPALTPSK